MPKVSVVIPTYNQPVLLLETLASVFAQTFVDFEVVVIDDGSTDDTPERLAEVAAREPRLRVLRQVNAGTGAARNRGVAEARGELVAMLDHDDLWMPRKLQTQVDFMAAHPKCVACVTPLASTLAPDRPMLQPGADSNEWGGERHGERGVVWRPFLRAAYKTPLFLTCSAMMFRPLMAQDVRFGEERGAMEDVQFYLRLLARGELGIAGEQVLLLYRMHADNASGRPAYWERGRRILRRMQSAGDFSELSPQAIADAALWLGFIGRAAAVTVLRFGSRWTSWRIYFAEWSHQARARQWKFLVGFPLLALSPKAMIHRWAKRT